MKMVGHKTQSVYSRYAIVDVAMMRESAEKLAALHEADRIATVEQRAVTGTVVDISSNKNS